MARWAGWGAGPAGAGAAGGPSRVFLGALAALSLAAAFALWRDGRTPSAAIALLGALYFALRVAGVIGRRRGDDDDEP
jgi:hypothetical protein